MRHKIRSRLSYANVMSTLAVFIALGGSSYAAVTLNGSHLKYRSVTGTKIKRNTLTGLEVRESRLSRVPRAAMADRLSESAAAAFRVRCPDDMFPIAGTCIEREARPPAPYGPAVTQCLAVGTPQGPGRRLPTHGELMAALTAVPLAGGGELTSSVYPSSTSAGELDVLYVTDRLGRAALTVGAAEGAKAFRCAMTPTN